MDRFFSSTPTDQCIFMSVIPVWLDCTINQLFFFFRLVKTLLFSMVRMTFAWNCPTEYYNEYKPENNAV